MLRLRRNNNRVLKREKGFQVYVVAEGDEREIDIHVGTTSLSGTYIVKYDITVELVNYDDTIRNHGHSEE
jgi:hypothetical protein